MHYTIEEAHHTVQRNETEMHQLRKEADAAIAAAAVAIQKWKAAKTRWTESYNVWVSLRKGRG